MGLKLHITSKWMENQFTKTHREYSHEKCAQNDFSKTSSLSDAGKP